METNSNNNPEVQQAVNDALQQEKKKKKKKKWIIIGIVIVVLIIIFAAASGSSDSDADNAAKSTQSISETQSDSTSEENSEGSQVIEPGTALSTEELKISYISCNTDFTDYDEYTKPADGNKIIRAQFSFENISSSDYYFDNMECYADNNKCESYIYADDYADPVLQSISPGRTLDAVVYYEVPKNAENIEIEMQPDTWDDSKIIFSVK